MAFTLADFNAVMVAHRTAANSINGLFSTLISARSTLQSSLEDKLMTTQIPLAESLFSRAISSLENAQSDLVQLSMACILDRTANVENFPEIADNNDYTEVLKAIHRFMVDVPTTIAKNTVTLSAITRSGPGGSPSAATIGYLYNTKKLPGNIAPGEGKLAHYGLFDTDTELPESDSYVGLCSIVDQIVLSGRPPQNVPYGQFTTFGNAGTITLGGTGALHMPANAFFEAFTVANTPDGWTIVAGAAGTEIKSDTTTVHTGSNALRLEGTSEIKYPIAGLVSGRQNLLLSINLKKGTGTTSGTYKLQLKGTGMTTQETAAFNATDLATATWTEKTLHCAIPAVIPSDLAIHIVTTTVDTTDGIYLDGGLLQPYTYWAGVGWALTKGTTSFLPGDKFTGTITNDYASNQQTWLARAHGFQLPSA